MRAVVIDAIGVEPQVREVPAPQPPAGGVVVDVSATGLCRSDWHAWAGHDQIQLPHIPGHELAGTISAVGEGVRSWRVGQRVTVPFVCGCGACTWCSRGDPQVCPHQQQPGFTHFGSFAEQVALHAAEANLVAVPDDVSDIAAASLGCRFATAYRGLTSRARLSAGETLAVIGAGGVGLSAVMIGHALGARVIAADRNPAALRLAARLGAEETVLVTEEPAAGAIAELTGGGADVAVDAVGSEQTCTDAMMSLRRRGRHVQIGLLPPVEGHPRVPMDRVIAWELDLFGSHGMAAGEYPEMLKLIAQGRLDPQQLVGRTVGLAEAARLLPRMDQPADAQAGVTMIRPTQL
ncbi:zinc-dependent alcohol dehydrogenase family protein [Nesterenkonia sp.]|uniref:zinc-dependent alcohol dehydrogenase family protein n=1 Tax=Nesterenkonia sp. TaxID=704201 RepID=UPI0026195103|nr:zinc-dependent alcohol dehydrogenase family protein [Nesterenkonia sp.]